MSGPRRAPSIEELRARIRSTGLRTTAPRIAVLRRLCGADTPLSHAQVMEDLAPDGWDRATIYRNLADLTEAGIVSRTDLGDHVWRYEMRPDGGGGAPGEHPHFMCVTCGEVKCLPGVRVELTDAGAPARSLTGRTLEVQLKGQCERCA
ncbi:transcriptional repressor [Myxococcota bacterium]|nr:transcriptional repressor [Myxococcota bacterium]